MRTRRGLGQRIPEALAPLLACLLAASTALGTAARAQAPQPSASLVAEIGALMREKAARTPIQQKISSRLLYEARLERLGAAAMAASGAPMLRAPRLRGTRARPEVEIEGTIDGALRAAIADERGTVTVALPERGFLRAHLPVASVERIAALPGVARIRLAIPPETRMLNVSEGDNAHRADQARTTFSVDGSGVTVGVLSDGVDSLAAVQASGDLPAVTVLAGQQGSGDEGTAMLEIVHDLAPGATLLFATAFNGQASFAANIVALRAAGADVIVDDVFYFAEAVYQDDDVAAAVDQVVADGALYFSSAGNAGNLNDGTAGVWEGAFADSGSLFQGSPAHDFGGGVIGNRIDDPPSQFYTLHWNDPLGASANDYDFFLVDAGLTTVIDSSTNAQNGNDDPFEIMSAESTDTGLVLVVVRFAGADRVLHLNSNRGELQFATDGQTSGHASARGAFGVAATDWFFATGPGGTFGGGESVELFSSDGPRRIYFEADGSEITPGNLTTSGGEVRDKPDLTAADCVTTASPGFSVFCGTSAAAPHAAAIAALALDAAAGHGLGRPELGLALATSALDIEAPGPDRDAGVGIVDARALLETLEQSCSDGIDNDGDGRTDGVDPGCADAATDFSERSPTLPCDDGLDNDGDGFADFDPDAGEGDPGCANPSSPSESPACQDGIDNDGQPGTDFDGGVSVLGVGNGDPAGSDPQCTQPWLGSESPPPVSCGLGPELAGLLTLLLGMRRLRRRTRA